MRALDRRVRKLEETIQRRSTASVRLLWDDEVVACGQHPGCMVEPASGTHYPGVVRLGFGGSHE